MISLGISFEPKIVTPTVTLGYFTWNFSIISGRKLIASVSTLAIST